MMETNRGYYGDFDEYKINAMYENPIGYGLDVENPVSMLDEEKYITGRRKIVQSMEDILSTPRGTRFMFPEYGSDLYKVLQEPNDMILVDVAELYIKESLKAWEPRVIIVDVICQISKKDPKVLLARIDYKMKDTSEVDSFVYSVNREVPEMR